MLNHMLRMTQLGLLAAGLLIAPQAVHAEEIVNQRGSLPGVTVEQKVVYSSTRKEYEAARDTILQRLRNKDPSAMVNPVDGHWKLVETTTMIGIEIPLPLLSKYGGVVGSSSGGTNIRQITAAEEALYTYEAKE